MERFLLQLPDTTSEVNYIPALRTQLSKYFNDFRSLLANSRAYRGDPPPEEIFWVTPGKTPPWWFIPQSPHLHGVNVLLVEELDLEAWAPIAYKAIKVFKRLHELEVSALKTH